MSNTERRWPVPVEVEKEIRWAGNDHDIAEMLKKGGILYCSRTGLGDKNPVKESK
jgi:hypothetical protein